jgi:TDG/mug DNA glycosylase family protein
MSEKPLPSFNGRLNKFKHKRSPPVTTTVTSVASTPAAIIRPKSSLARVAKPVPATGNVRRVSKKKNISPTDLPQLPLLLEPGLVCVFIGFNPGIQSSLQGHSYAHRSNLFWKMIYESGCVNEPVTYHDDRSMIKRYGYGFHDLVLRPTRSIDELSRAEMLDNVPRLERTLQTYEPAIICFVGKGIWEKIYKYKTGRSLPKDRFAWGLQKNIDFTFISKDCSTKLFVMPSTSGLAAGMSREHKLALWKELAIIITQEREAQKK